MKCQKCGHINEMSAQFCGNCGSKLIAEQPTSSSRLSRKKILILLGIIIGIFVILLIGFMLNKKGNFKDPFADINELPSIETENTTNMHKEVNSFAKNIENEYKRGRITSDEYIIQLAYSVFEQNKLSSKYKKMELDFNEPNELFERAGAMVDKLSPETLAYIFEKYTLGDVQWNIDDKASISGTANSLQKYETIPLVSEAANVSKLDQVTLSESGNFLVYYTKEGANAITDADAKKIASFLESTVSFYKTKYGFDYKFSAQYDFESDTSLIKANPKTSKGKAERLLAKNNIDPKHLDTAMPVFIIDTDAENTGALGYYVSPIAEFAKIVLKIMDVFDDMGTQMDNVMTTYSFPFFVVSSSLNDFDDTKIVLAHELFHHYQKYICGDGEYSKCTSGNFTEETTADLAASQAAGVNKMGTAINGHAAMYIADVDSSMDQIGFKEYGEAGLGYGAFVFATNYASSVNNGSDIVFNSMKKAEPLKYLYENAGGKYKNILLTTAEKNLTLDYKNKLLIANEDGKVLYPTNYKNIKNQNNVETNSINYSSMHYYYVRPQEYNQTAQLTFSSKATNLSLQLFVKEKNSYKLLYTQDLNKEFTLNIKDFYNYPEIAFAIINTDISGVSSYSYEVNNKGTKTPTVTADSLKLTKFEDTLENSSSFVCHMIEEDEEYKTVTQINISFDKKSKIADMYFKATIQMKDYNPDDPAYAIAQKFVSGLLHTMQLTMEEQFKNFKVITEEGTDKYSVTFKITKNFYEALKNSIELTGEDKMSIASSLQKEGFTCSYK